MIEKTEPQGADSAPSAPLNTPRPPTQSTPSTTDEARAVWAGGCSGLLGLLAGLIAFWGKQVPLFDRDLSIGILAILSALVATAGAYTWSQLSLWTRRGRTPGYRPESLFRRILAGIGLMLTHLAITLFAVLGAFALLALSFRGLTLPLPHSAALVAISAMLAGYASSLSGADRSTQNLANLLTILMAGGVLTAMLTAPEPDWWIHHFSYLGGGRGASGLTFNGTLIVAGLVLITLADRLTDDLSRAAVTAGARTDVVRTLLILAGACCTLTGVFPYDWYEPLHMAFAFTMLLSIAALMALAPWAIPKLSASFRLASLALLSVPALSWVLFLAGTFSWTGVELVCALGCFAWLVLFIRTTNAVIHESPPAEGS